MTRKSQNPPRSRVHELSKLSTVDLIAVCQDLYGEHGRGECRYMVARLDRWQLIATIRDLETGRLPVAAAA